MGDFPGNAAPLPEIDTSRPHPARIYDYGFATHTTAEHDPEGWASVARAYTAANIQGQVRDSGEFARLVFSSLDLVPPGVVLVSEWRPDDEGPRPAPAEVSCYGGVARKP